MGIGDAVSFDVDVPRETEQSLDRSAVIFLVPIVGITASEGLLYFGYTYYSLVAHFLTLLITLFAPLRYGDETAVFRALALVPVFRLVNLGMPVFFELTIYWFPLIYGPFIPGLYLLARNFRPIGPELRMRRATLLFLPLALPLSAMLGAMEYSIIQPPALIPSWTVGNLLLITIVMIGFVGLVEELLFRGILQRTLERRLGRWSGLFIASALFGLMHSGYGVPMEVFFAGAIGFVFGLIYDWTDSLALITVLHGILNVFLFAVLPFQASNLFGLLG